MAPTVFTCEREMKRPRLHRRLRQILKPRQHFTVVKIDGPRLYYGLGGACDFLDFGSKVFRIGFIQSLAVVETMMGDVFIVLPTGYQKMPWVFDRVMWHS